MLIRCDNSLAFRQESKLMLWFVNWICFIFRSEMSKWREINLHFYYQQKFHEYFHVRILNTFQRIIIWSDRSIMKFNKEWTLTPMSDHRLHKNANFITIFHFSIDMNIEFPNDFVIAFQPLVAPSTHAKGLFWRTNGGDFVCFRTETSNAFARKVEGMNFIRFS